MAEPSFNNSIVLFQEPSSSTITHMHSSIDDVVDKKTITTLRLFGHTIVVEDQPARRIKTDHTTNKQDIPPRLFADRPKLAAIMPSNRIRRNTKRYNQQDEAEPDIPPRILQEFNNSYPVFLCKKKLQVSDVLEQKSRLFVTDRRGKLMKFLTDEEKATLADKDKVKGIEVYAVDQRGRYYELVLAKWPSLKMHVLKKNWNRVIADNMVNEGDWVELWGFRQESKLFLAVNFKKAVENINKELVPC